MAVDAPAMEDTTAWGKADLLMRARQNTGMELSLERVAQIVGAEQAASLAGSIRRVAALEHATPETLVFAQDAPSLSRALASDAGVILASRSLREELPASDARVLWVKDARLAFAEIGEALIRGPEGTEIDASAMINPGARIGERVRIGAGVVVEEGAEVGDDCRLAPRVVVHKGTCLGARVVVQAGAVLGSDGFGYVRSSGTGRYVLFPQQGTLVVEDDVSIGANTTIDRGALGETRIGRGTKIDNLVHIAHNCRIGKDVVIAAQTGIAGSSTIGDGAVIAGQVGIADHVEIGPAVVLGAKAGVPSNKRLLGAGRIFWGIPARPIQQYLQELALLRRGLKRER